MVCVSCYVIRPSALLQKPQHCQHLTDALHCRIALGDNQFLGLLDNVKQHLVIKGASADVSAYVEDVLVTQHQRYHEWMTAEADKRRALITYLTSLEVSAHSMQQQHCLDRYIDRLCKAAVNVTRVQRAVCGSLLHVM